MQAARLTPLKYEQLMGQDETGRPSASAHSTTAPSLTDTIIGTGQRDRANKENQSRRKGKASGAPASSRPRSGRHTADDIASRYAGLTLQPVAQLQAPEYPFGSGRCAKTTLQEISGSTLVGRPSEDQVRQSLACTDVGSWIDNLSHLYIKVLSQCAALW